MKKNYLKGISLVDMNEEEADNMEIELADEINRSPFFKMSNKMNVEDKADNSAKAEK